MPTYGQRSLENLKDVHPDLVRLCNEVILHFDHAVTTGHRNQADQDMAYAAGFSQVKWPNGKHNSLPSNAVDLVSWPVNWEDNRRALYFAGFVMGVAARMGIKIRWGGDWDQDTEVSDNAFNDLGHFELAD